jgi:hypothetical protein
MAVEKEIEKTEGVPSPNAVFDESGNFLVYTTLLGIKVYGIRYHNHIYSILLITISNFRLSTCILTKWQEYLGKLRTQKGFSDWPCFKVKAVVGE